MKEKNTALAPLRRWLAVAAVGLILLFSLLYLLAQLRPGLEFGDEMLYPADTGGEGAVYTGRVDGAWAVLAVGEDGAITYRWGETEYGPYTVRTDPTAVPDGDMADFLTGVELCRGDQVRFRGGWLETGDTFLLLAEDGTPVWGSAVPEDGEDDPHAPPLEALLSLSQGTPELIRRGNPLFWLLGTFAAVVALAEILFADQLFRHRLSFHIRTPERAEPSDWELARRVLAPLFLLLGALIAYLAGLSLFLH